MFTQKSMHADSMIGQVVLKKYTLLKKLGEGSFGMLYKASSPEGDFALKFEKRTKSNLLLETSFTISITLLLGSRDTNCSFSKI